MQDVAKGGEGKAARYDERQYNVEAHHRAHGGRPLPSALERKIPHDPDCKFTLTRLCVTEVIHELTGSGDRVDQVLLLDRGAEMLDKAVNVLK